MKNLKDLLPKRDITSVSNIIDEKTIFHICRMVIIKEYGVRGRENIIPTFYKDKKLFISPRSSLWANEVSLERESLCRKINSILGQEAVKEIRISQQQ